MANKRRPKKTKALYKKYSAGGLISNNSSIHHGNSAIFDSEEDEDEIEMDDLKNNSLNDDCSSLKLPKNDVVKCSINDFKSYKTEMIEMCVTFSKTKKPKIQFPIEIYNLILQFTSVQKKNPKYLRVSKTFYLLYLPILYHSPNLDSYNFFTFVETISKPKCKLGSLVRYLNLSPIIQSGKNSYVSKILRRCSANLEVFIAPQTSFGYAPLISLRSCKNIKVLDLSLVSETVNLSELFHAIKNAKRLTHLSFPRSSISCEGYDDNFWPPNLWYLRLSGGVTNEFVQNSIFPETIIKLEFAHCPSLKDFAIYNMLNKFGRSLTHLSIQYPMPGLTETSMDYIFTYCPNLTFLQMTADYCSRSLFDEEMLPYLFESKRPLHTLWLESSGGLGQTSKIHPDDLTIAIMEDRLSSLKYIRISSKLGWDLTGDDVGDLVNLLEERNGGLYINYY